MLQSSTELGCTQSAAILCHGIFKRMHRAKVGEHIHRRSDVHIVSQLPALLGQHVQRHRLRASLRRRYIRSHTRLSNRRSDVPLLLLGPLRRLTSRFFPRFLRLVGATLAHARRLGFHGSGTLLWRSILGPRRRRLRHGPKQLVPSAHVMRKPRLGRRSRAWLFGRRWGRRLLGGCRLWRRRLRRN